MLAERPGIKDPENPVALGKGRGGVAFHDVHFSYVPDRPGLGADPEEDLMAKFRV